MVWTLLLTLLKSVEVRESFLHMQAKLGVIVCPATELSGRPHCNLQSPRLLEWICFTLAKNLFRLVMLEPPCTTFSPASHPCVRSYRPLGFCRTNPNGGSFSFDAGVPLWLCLFKFGQVITGFFVMAMVVCLAGYCGCHVGIEPPNLIRLDSW